MKYETTIDSIYTSNLKRTGRAAFILYTITLYCLRRIYFHCMCTLTFQIVEITQRTGFDNLRLTVDDGLGGGRRGRRGRRRRRRGRGRRRRNGRRLFHDDGGRGRFVRRGGQYELRVLVKKQKKNPIRRITSEQRPERKSCVLVTVGVYTDDARLLSVATRAATARTAVAAGGAARTMSRRSWRLGFATCARSAAPCTRGT